MADINHLVKLSQQYQQLATLAQQNKASQYTDSVIQQMVGLANGGIVATKHLLSLPQYRHSTGLSAMKEKLPQVVQMLNSYGPSSGDAFFSSLGTILDGISFYTSKGNAGTGYDPITAISDQGYTAPAYYVSTLLGLMEKLKASQQQTKQSPWEPMNKDPMAVQLTKQQNESKKT